VGAVTVKLERWLNAALGDGDFGGKLDQVTLYVIAVYDDAAENQRFFPRGGLGRSKNPFTGETYVNLTYAAGALPARLESATLEEAMRMVSSSLMASVLVRPKRLPKGFECDRFTHAMTLALDTYDTV
jgi:hypothetical protein